MSDRTEVENTEEKEKGSGEGDEKDQINPLSFQRRSTLVCFELDYRHFFIYVP